MTAVKIKGQVSDTPFFEKPFAFPGITQLDC